MSDSDVQVTFGANVAGLTAGSQAAKNEIDRLVAAIALLQKTVGAAAKASTGELVAALNSVGTSANTASSAVDRASTSHKANAAASGVAAHGVSGITRELIVLGHEASQGRWTRLGGSLTVMAEYATPRLAQSINQRHQRRGDQTWVVRREIGGRPYNREAVHCEVELGLQRGVGCDFHVGSSRISPAVDAVLSKLTFLS